MDKYIAIQTKNNNKVLLSDLKDTIEYRARVKVTRGEDLTDDEKLHISRGINFCGATRFITKSGWAFDFRPVVSQYYVWMDREWAFYVATDLSTLFRMIGADPDDFTINPKGVEARIPERVCEYEGRMYDETPIVSREIAGRAMEMSAENLFRYMDEGTVSLAVRVG